jgi:hypothetical protein
MSSDFQVVESAEDLLFPGIVWWDGDLPLYMPVFQVVVVA